MIRVDARRWPSVAVMRVERLKREIEMRLALGGTASLEPEKPSLPTLDDCARTWLEDIAQERKPSTAGFYGKYFRL